MRCFKIKVLKLYKLVIIKFSRLTNEAVLIIEDLNIRVSYLLPTGRTVTC